MQKNFFEGIGCKDMKPPERGIDLPPGLGGSSSTKDERNFIY
jgi:hypothetical protein